MADLIDLDAVLKKIETLRKAYMLYEPAGMGGISAICHCRDIVNEIPAVNRWIPCSERLPYGGRVLATTKQGYVVDVIFVAKGSQWYRNGEHFTLDAVIAWMPMPDAYEPPESEVHGDE